MFCTLLTWKCASRHNGVHFFDIESTSNRQKVARTCGNFTFYFQMCFAPQRRALFRHLNFQKWSEHGVFCTFYFQMCFAPQRRALFRHRTSKSQFPKVVRAWCVLTCFSLPNVLRATTACTFSTSQLPKVVRDLTCFDTFDFKMCFAPQRRALFQHLNFQKWSET